MACPHSNYDSEEGRFYCDVSGDQCVFLIPNEKSCIREGYLDNPDEEE